VLRVENRSGVAQRVSLPSARTCDFSLSAPDGSELWRFSRGRMYAQMLTELAFEPGEQREFRATFDPSLRRGARAPLAPGRYSLRGWLETGGGAAAEAPPVELVLE